MNKFNDLFTDDRDRIIFTIMLRTIKETNTKLQDGFKSFIKACIRSREEHSSEEYYCNVSYWPKDTNNCIGLFPALFLARLVNLGIVNVGRHCNYPIFISNFLYYATRSIFLSSNKVTTNEIYSAVKKIEPTNFEVEEKINQFKSEFFLSHTIDEIEKDFVSPFQIGI